MSLLKKVIQELNEADIISSSNDSPILKHVDSLAEALVEECIVLAKQVYEEEGAGSKSKAKNEKEYIEYAKKQFLSPDYKRAIMDNIVEAYNDIIE